VKPVNAVGKIKVVAFVIIINYRGAAAFIVQISRIRSDQFHIVHTVNMSIRIGPVGRENVVFPSF
jgi:hypothetical protein